VESLVIKADFWRGRRVFLTGHTGFKGAWTSLLLRRLQAKVVGYALPPDSPNSLFDLTEVSAGLEHKIGDVRDLPTLQSALQQAEPEIVVHMAAQSLVRRSYADPVETYSTNVMGTVNLLEAVRHTPSVRAVVVVTSDKCYENVNWVWGYRETDHLGGHDPYSNSKGCAELVVTSYRRSFFGEKSSAVIASARAGNVIGGGDWARDRLVPDAMRAFMTNVPLRIRNPQAVRPWQHVIDPVMGYLLLAERLFTSGNAFAEAWNFGPSVDSEVPVSTVVSGLAGLWGSDARWERDGGEHPHEAPYLKLDCSKAFARLSWRPLVSLDEALTLTVSWYRALASGADIRGPTETQIEAMLERAAAGSAPA
jgi:CDP-glucose 4,6-dehydratase